MATTTTTPTTTVTTTWDWKHFAISHIAWIIIVGILIVGGHAYNAESKARAAAEATVKADETQVSTLQQGIVQNNAAIATLQQQMAQRDAANAAQIAALTKVINAVKTPQQAGAALPQVVTTPLPTPVVVAPDGSWNVPAVDVLPLFTQIADDKVCRVDLTAVQADLTDEKNIVVKDDATIADETAQIKLKQDEITALTRKPTFWHRVGGTIKQVGIGIGIGLALSRL